MFINQVGFFFVCLSSVFCVLVRCDLSIRVFCVSVECVSQLFVVCGCVVYSSGMYVGLNDPSMQITSSIGCQTTYTTGECCINIKTGCDR